MKPKYFIILLSMVLGLMLVSLPVGPSWLTSLTSPVRETVAGWLVDGRQFVGWFGDVRRLTEERDALAAERNKLLSEVVQMETIERQNRALQEQLEVADELRGRKMLLAHMVGVEVQGGVSYVLIDRGEVDGVKVGQVVMTDGVLMGRVKRVMRTSAAVQPPQSMGSVIPVKIRYGSEISKGVVRGNYNLTAELTQVLLNEKLQSGGVIETSGEGGSFPPNLVVGKVGKVERQESRPFQSAEVEMLWQIDQLETVFVLQEGK